MRGQVFDIEGNKVFTFGGASSHDIDGGILDRNNKDFRSKRRALESEWIPYRILNESWWPQELASEEEMQEGWKNLEKHNNEVDFIVTHCASSSTQALMGSSYKPDKQTAYFEEIKNNVKFKKWFFGHYHHDCCINDKEILNYEKITRVF